MATETLGGLERGFLLGGTKTNKSKKNGGKQASSTFETSSESKLKQKSKSLGMKTGFLLGKPSKSAPIKSTTTPLTKSSPAVAPALSTSPKTTAKTKKKKSSGGFTKGFLVSKKKTRPAPKTSYQRPVAASQDLLSLEGPSVASSTFTNTPLSSSSSSSFLVVDNDRHVNTEKADKGKRESASKSLISVIDDDYDENDNNNGKQGPNDMADTAPSRPLISILGEEEEEEDIIIRTEHSTSSSTDKTRTEEGGDDVFLFQEQSTTFYPGGCRPETPIREPQHSVAESSSALFEKSRRLDRMNPPSSSSSRPSTRIDTSLKNEPSDLSPSVVDSHHETSFLEFQQELARMTWNNNEAKKVGSESIVKKWSPSEVSWAWEWLFSLSKASSTHHALIESLLQHHPSTIRLWLVSETPQNRAQALQLIQWIQEFLTAPNRAPPKPCFATVGVWRDNVLPGMLILADQPRRTVLAQEAWTTCILLTVWSCEQFSGGDTSQESTPSILLTLMDNLDRLLKTQLRWKQGKKKSAKNQAQIRLAENWIQVNDRCRKDRLVLDWQTQMFGIPLLEGSKNNWGGLYHLFCSDLLATRGVGAQGLSKVWKLVKPSSLDPIDQGTLLRGILAQLSTTKQLDSDTQDATTTNVLSLLSDIQDRDTCELALSILNFMCFDSNGLPGDLLSHIGPGLPKSVEQLLDAVSTQSGSERHQEVDRETPVEAISAFVANCIIALPNGVDAVEALISRQGMGDFTARILFQILSIFLNLSRSTGENVNGQNSSRSTSLQDHVQDRLVDEVPTSSCVRKCLALYDRAMLGDMDAGQLTRSMPKLLKMLDDHCESQDVLSSDIESSVVSILTWNLESYAAKGDVTTFVDEVAKFLYNTKRSGGIRATESSQDTILTKICGRWRCLLLTESKVPDSGFAALLLATARAISCHPSSVTLLAFFGAIVGDDISVDLRSIEYARLRIMLAVERLFDFFARKMDEMQNDASDEIFRRLSPLLILRRVPTSYFDVSRKEAERRSFANLYIVSSKVVDHLASLLEVGSPSDHKGVTPEERRLAAEVAGRALNFGHRMDAAQRSLPSYRSSSTFHCICLPVFGDLMKETVPGGAQLESKSISVVRKARAALYAACHSVPNDERDKEELWEQEYRKTASFALYVMGIPLDGLEDDISREVIQLQTGCIEFFAISLSRTFSKKGDSSDPSTETLGLSLHKPGTTTLLEPFKDISNAIIHILSVGNPHAEDEWICVAESHFLTCSSAVAKEVSFQAKTCLWNAMILVAQRCDDNDGSLTAFGKSILPLIADWGTDAKSSSGGNVHHLLCSAAAMQTAFIVITRSRSLECLGGHNRSKATYVGLLHDWALHAIKQKLNSSGNDGNTALRMAALKLILGLVTIDAMEGDDDPALPSCLGSGKLAETVSVVKELSNHGPNDDVRALANRILSASNQA